MRKPKKFDFDLIVLGAGAGGNAATHQAAMLGKKVAVVEPDKLGGDCANYGCVPTKAFLQAADVMSTAQMASKYGVRVGDLSFDYPSIKAWKEHAVRKTDTIESEHFHHDKSVVHIRGHASFLNPWSVQVGQEVYRAKKFLIATGTKATAPPVPGLKEAGFIGYHEATNLSRLPKSIFIVGGGPVGCEFAHFFRTFGINVHVAEMAPRLVAMEDPEVGEMIEEAFERRGIKVYCGAKVVSIEQRGHHKIVHFELNGRQHQVEVEEIMLSAGKVPNTDIGLENASVKYDKHGIWVNRYLQTTTKHIYAAGDVVGPYRFTHTATYQSDLAGYNMFKKRKKTQVNYRAMPRCVFVDPEIAAVGATEKQLQDEGTSYQVGGVPITIINKAITSGQNLGFVKVLAATDGTLLGASIASPHAGEMIHELTLAIQYKMKASAIVKTIHAFPTWSEAVRLACMQIKSR